VTALLVTGATTPLGRLFVETSAANPSVRHVVAVGREPAEATPWADGLDGVTYLQIDLTRSRSIRRVLFGPVRDLGVDVVVDMARHRGAGARGRKVHRLNVESTRLMLRLAENHPTLTTFVHRGSGQVYRIRAEQPDVLQEDQPLDLSPSAPQWVRDRVEADVAVCGRMGMNGLRIVVLRCAEILAPEMGSQLLDFFRSRVCARPLGFDPMVGVLSLQDAVAALTAAVEGDAQGVFNIPGRDVLPLSEAIRRVGRRDLALPGPALGPLYRARARLRGTEFRYDLNQWRFHFSAVLSGRRARDELGYEPRHPVDWASLARFVA